MPELRRPEREFQIRAHLPLCSLRAAAAAFGLSEDARELAQSSGRREGALIRPQPAHVAGRGAREPSSSR